MSEETEKRMQETGMRPERVGGYLFFEIPLLPEPSLSVGTQAWHEFARSIVSKPCNPPEVEKAVEEMRKRGESDA